MKEERYFKTLATLRHDGNFWTVTIGSYYKSFEEAENAGRDFKKIFSEMVFELKVIEMKEGC